MVRPPSGSGWLGAAWRGVAQSCCCCCRWLMVLFRHAAIASPCSALQLCTGQLYTLTCLSAIAHPCLPDVLLSVWVFSIPSAASESVLLRSAYLVLICFLYQTLRVSWSPGQDQSVTPDRLLQRPTQHQALLDRLHHNHHDELQFCKESSIPRCMYTLLVKVDETETIVERKAASCSQSDPSCIKSSPS